MTRLAITRLVPVMILTLVSAVAAPLETEAETIEVIPYYAGGYRYQQYGQGTAFPAGIEFNTFDDGAFSVGQAPFGSGGCGLPVATPWGPNSNLAVRQRFTADGPITGANIRFGIDNDVRVFMNGVQIADVVHEGCANFDNFSFPIPAGVIQAGENLLVALCVDRGSISWFDITLTYEDSAPVLTAPPTATVSEGETLALSVSVTDPDGDSIGSLTVTPLPIGAVFTPAVDNSSGTLTWTPGFDQAGTYLVTFTAANALTASASTNITVVNVDRPPLISPVLDQAVAEGSTLDVTVAAVDLDGESVTMSFVGPPFATLAVDGQGTSQANGTIHLAPSYTDSGVYPGNIVRAEAAGLTSQEAFTITVANTNRIPVLQGPGGIQASEGFPLSFEVIATDPDGDHVRLRTFNMPVGSLFIDRGDNTGEFSWLPDYGQAGEYDVVFVGQDDLGGIADPLHVWIEVDNVNRAPIAVPGGPYSGVVGVPIPFDGTGSADPDGDVLMFFWTFGDGLSGVGVLVSHTYMSGGNYLVNLTVTDGSASHSAATSATVQGVFQAAAFLEGGNQTTRLGSGKSSTCVQIEPVAGSYRNTSVDLGSILLLSPGTGSVDMIPAIANKTIIGADRNRNGIDEITACFAKPMLRDLFSSLASGRHIVPVEIVGSLSTGGTFRAALDMEVVSSGGGLASSLAPNPANPTAVLTFRLTRPGRTRAQLFDAAGRLVRTLLSGAELGEGYHDVTVDGRNDAGERLRSGVYFWRLEAEGGAETGRFVVAR